jgi:hypothetical protein
MATATTMILVEEKMAEQIQAPFTEDQVNSLNEYQPSGVFHPFTCGGDKCRNDLVATKEGWVCPDPECDYTQDWAWNWMADWSWKKMDWRGS